MNANQVTKASVSTMDLATANSALTAKGITALQRQMIQTRINKLSTPAPEVQAPVETVQETIAADAVTAPGTESPEVPAPVVIAKVEKNKPGETTFTIPAFTIDTKGIRAGTKDNPLARITYTEKGTNKVCAGTVQRIFQFSDEAKYKHLGAPRQEAKIKGDNGNRIYRFEEEIHLEVIVPVVEDVVPEVIESVLLPEVVEEAKA